MNILVLSRFAYDQSPYRIFVHDQVKAYQALGHQVRVISCLSRFKKGVNAYALHKKEAVVDGVRVYYPRHLSLSRYGQYGANVAFGYRAVLRLVKKLRRDFPIDLIHAHFIDFDGAVAVRLKKKLGIPVVITTHGYDTVDELAAGNGPKLLPICRQADAVVAVSSMLKNALLREDPSLSIRVILNGFNLQDCPRDVKKEPYSIIAVGALVERKKFHVVIQALAQVQKRYPQATLTLVGEGGERVRLEALIQELHLEQSVRLTGFLPNQQVMALMAAHQVFAMPSVHEGFGIVYLEAMAAGCVCIGTQKEGVADLIVSGENGLLVPPDDANTLANEIAALFASPNDRQRLAQAGQQAAVTLTWEENAKKNLALFEEILANRG